MKHAILFCLLFCFGLISCTSPTIETPTSLSQAQPTKTLSPVLSFTPSPMPTLPPPSLTPPSPFTSTSTPFLTLSPTPAAASTLSPSPSPTSNPTATFPPPHTGKLYFFWDPEFPRESDLFEPQHNLYLATPGKTPIEWDFTVLLTQLTCLPEPVFSTDQRYMAFKLLGDLNGDGSISCDGARRGFDANNLFVYDLQANQLTPLTTNFPLTFGVSWYPQSQRLTYTDEWVVYSLDITSGEINPITEPFPERTYGLFWSVDGKWLAAVPSGPLHLYNLESKQLISMEGTGNPFNLSWSPDEQWLASNLLLNQGLFLFNSHSLQSFQLVEKEVYAHFAWSPNGSWLAFTKGIRENSTTIAHKTLQLWDALTQTSSTIAELQDIHHILWVEDSSMLVISFSEENQSGLFKIDIATGTRENLFQREGEYKIKLLSWSPDNQWLLFHLEGWGDENWEQDSLQMIHISSHATYPILDTSSTDAPYGFFWMP